MDGCLTTARLFVFGAILARGYLATAVAVASARGASGLAVDAPSAAPPVPATLPFPAVTITDHFRAFFARAPASGAHQLFYSNSRTPARTHDSIQQQQKNATTGASQYYTLFTLGLHRTSSTNYTALSATFLLNIASWQQPEHSTNEQAKPPSAILLH